jgi:hypothetical protein
MRSMQTLENKIIARIYGKGRGWAFTPKSLLRCGDARLVGMALTGSLAKGPFGVWLADSLTTRAQTQPRATWPRQEESAALLFKHYADSVSVTSAADKTFSQSVFQALPRRA